jgi:hypothetical protein
MPVKERELLGAMGGIIGGIQIEGDPVNPAPESLGMPPDDAPGQGLAHAIQFLDSDRISKRDTVGCEARSRPSTGSRSRSSLQMGSLAKQAESLASG